MLGLAQVTFQGGLDIIYDCQDIEFDRTHGIHSVPARFGIVGALHWSRGCHLSTILLLGVLGIMMSLGTLYWTGLTIMSLLFFYEHSLIKPHDFSRSKMAVFHVNALASVSLFVFTFSSLFASFSI